MVSFAMTEKRDGDLLEACDALAWRFGEAMVCPFSCRPACREVARRRGGASLRLNQGRGPPSMHWRRTSVLQTHGGEGRRGGRRAACVTNTAIAGTWGRVARQQRCGRASASAAALPQKVWSRSAATPGRRRGRPAASGRASSSLPPSAKCGAVIGFRQNALAAQSTQLAMLGGDVSAVPRRARGRFMTVAGV